MSVNYVRTQLEKGPSMMITKTCNIYRPRKKSQTKCVCRRQTKGHETRRTGVGRPILGKDKETHGKEKGGNFAV